MANKQRYIDVLTRILNDHYNDVKRDCASKERQRYIDGYLIAARALDVFSFDELKKTIDEIHINVFGKTIQERRLSEDGKSDQSDNFLKIPTYVREGISLKDKL